MRAFRLRLEGIVWLAAWRIARVLPERWVVRAFERLALRSYRRGGRRRAVVEANLVPVVGSARAAEVARRAFALYGRYWAETFRMQDLSREELARRFSVDGVEHIERAYAAGSGAVLATLHLGNWDAGGRWVAERWPLTAVVEVLRPRVLFDRFMEHRRAMGLSIVPLERGGDATGRCIEAVRSGGLVALVADRDMSGSGVEVEMFGRRTKMPPGPAVIAARTGAPLIPACISQTEGGDWHAVVLPPIEVDDVGPTVQRLAHAFETLISMDPAQWHAFSPQWIDEPARAPSP